MASLSANPSPIYRRTRFVCISDTHNCTVKLPQGDVLIHAGDLTNQGSYSELSKAVQWLEKADFEAKIIIAGNHDLTLDREFYAEHGTRFHNQIQQDPAQCLALLRESKTITYLDHASTTIRLTSPKGSGTTFTVFGSPYSPRDGLWAFGYDRIERDHLPIPESSPSIISPTNPWSSIPLSTDILITHTPPFTHCDGSRSPNTTQTGCEALRRALWRVRPRLHVCGHIHSGRGAERVRWALDGPDGAYAEAGVERWEDPSPMGNVAGSGKMSLVDLTARGGRRPLDNDGSDSGREGRDVVGLPGKSPELGGGEGDLLEDHSNLDTNSPPIDQGQDHPGAGNTTRTPGLGGGPSANAPTCDGDRNPEWERVRARGALLDRLGRRETCVVNCAIMATSFPHTGGNRLNKPIVVDLDLPVWT